MELGFLGAGNMAEALVRGGIASGYVQAGEVMLFDLREDRLADLKSDLGVQTSSSAEELVGVCKRIVFAVKPQNMPDLMAAFSADSAITSAYGDKLFISICAGLSTDTIANGLVGESGAPTPRVVRVMPNTPALVQKGAAGVSGGSAATADDVTWVLGMMRGVGIAEEISEDQMEQLTAISGSGPAYVFKMMEELEASATALGLEAGMARRLVLQTVLGAATLANKQSDVPPAELRRRVTSPGGITADAIEALEGAGFGEAIRACTEAAVRRGKEMAEGK